MTSHKNSPIPLIKSVLFWFCFFVAPLFLAAGTLNWWQAWIFVIVNLSSITFVIQVIYKNNPDLEHERATARTHTKKWDKILVPLIVALLPMLSNILAGLDKRYHWTPPIPIFETLTALALYIASTALIAWSMKANRYFSSHFHIQKDRGHTVTHHGPYAIIRHPGYLGMILGSITLPILLESHLTLIIGITNGFLIVLRTALEDRSLQDELPGYTLYTEKTKYRLIPRIW